jgi:hypothetical protein
LPINRSVVAGRKKGTTGRTGEANGDIVRWGKKVGVGMGKIPKQRPVD